MKYKKIILIIVLLLLSHLVLATNVCGQDGKQACQYDEEGKTTPGVILKVNTNEKKIAITLDASGPNSLNLDSTDNNNARYDQELIDYLKSQNVKTTLFMTGEWVLKHENIAKQLSRDPNFQIQNHGYKHKPCTISDSHVYKIKATQNEQEIREEIQQASRIIKEKTGIQTKYYRPGTGMADPKCVQISQELNHQVVDWSLNGDHGTSDKANQVKNNWLNAKPGDILISHFNRPNKETAQGVKLAIPQLKSQGFEFVFLDELFQLGQAVDGQSNQVNIRGDTRANQDNTQSKGDTRTSGDVSQDIRSVQERIQYLEDEIENLEEGELKQSKVQELEILNRNIEELDSDLPTSQDIRSVQERIQDLEDEIENLEEGELKQSKVQELEILERNLQELRFGPTTNEISFRNILHIGDSHTAGAYGKELDRLFKSNNIEINTYGCVSATSSHYVNGNLRCLSSSTFQNQVKDYDISEIEPTSLINNHNPDLIIVSLGSNYNSKAGVESGKINEFLNKLSSKTCYWVGAPKAKHTNVKAYEINSALKNSIGSRCTFIDATQLTDEGKLGSDGLHYTSQGGKQWAQGVYNQISQGANLQPSQTSQVSTSRTQTPSQNVATTTTVFELFDVDRAWVKIGKIFFGESYNKVWVRGKGWRSIQEATKTSSTGSSNYDPSVFSGSIGLTPQKIALVKKIASDMDEDPIFPLAIIGPESRGDPNAISGSGCAGVMQVCKTSASNIYIQVQCDQRNGKSKCDKNSCVNNGGYNWCNTCNSNDANCVQDDRFDPVKNIKAGIKVIKDKKKSVTRCVAGEDLIKCQSSAYNAGASVVNLAIQRTGKSNPTWNEVYQIYQRDNVELFRSASSNYKKGVFVGEEGAQIIRQKISATPNYVNKIYRNYQIFKNQVSPTPSPTSPITPTPSSNANIQIRTSFVCDLEGNNLEKAKELDILLHDGIILIADSLSGSSKYPSGATDLKQEILNMYPNSFKVHQASYLKSELKENISQLRIFNLKEEDKPGEKTYSLVSVNNNQEIELEKVNDNTYKIPRNLCMSTYDLNDHSRRPSTGLIIVYNSKKSINIENPCFDRRKAGFEKEMNSFLPNHLVDLEYPRGALKEICS